MREVWTRSSGPDVTSNVVDWLDIGLVQEVPRGPLLDAEIVDHREWIVAVLDDARLCYDVVGDTARVFGYLPKSHELLDE